MSYDAVQGNSIYGEHRGHKIWISYHSTWDRADVDIIETSNMRHYSFELAIINPDSSNLGGRLLTTARCWVDGTIAQIAAA